MCDFRSIKGSKTSWEAQKINKRQFHENQDWKRIRRGLLIIQQYVRLLDIIKQHVHKRKGLQVPKLHKLP